MKYRLKPGEETLELVDGPGAGRKFERGRAYDEAAIPAAVRGRFEKIREKKPAPEPGEARKNEPEGGQE